MKTIIVGGGIMGLCAAWALRRLGAEVTLIEQASLPNPLGSSVDQHRLIRYPYGAARGYARMVHAAYDSWERLWRDLGVTLYVETGTLVLSGPGDDWAAQSRTMLAAEGIQHESLDAAALAARFPLLDGAGIAEAFQCEHGGILRAEAIVGSLKHHLLDRGLRLLSRMRVESVDAEAGAVRLADGRRLQADQVLVAAGPWTAALLPDLAEMARPSRQVAVYLAPPPDLAVAWYHAPMLLDIGQQTGFYAVPPRISGDGMRLGLKISDHRFGPTGDPGAPFAGERQARPDEIEAILAPARQRLVRFDEYRVVEARTCFYDVAPEERFQFHRLGPRCAAFCGSSGHGFKFASCLGEAMALALTGQADFAAVADWIGGALLAPADQPAFGVFGGVFGGINALPASASDSSA
ncbi:FAD-dependent oxidoreductase [Ferrovibrio sp.]|uniref:FAD-dependent oxidoreductase n=1 Tax=Ferrovibrio sp. TaxID=1917215 RepID=UPI001B43EA10|nr:FAD-dependent oxidoreductase [Ferrovibrio sp.]MBP7062589.1 FAD-dependent oxidoreductase [Ferrovibrio sp.]